MSNLGIITHGYNSLSDLSKEMNNDVIVLKKSFYKLSDSKKITHERVETSKKQLVVLLKYLQKDLIPDPNSTNKSTLPEMFVNQVRVANRSSLSYYLTDLQKTIHNLQGEGKITERDLELLDGLSAMIDTETSRMFRKIWR